MFYTVLMTTTLTRTPSKLIVIEVRQAALAILDEKGPDGFTVRAIAKRANVAPMAIYNHFDGVNGVLEALWIEGFEALREAITFHSGDPLWDLMNAGRGYRSFALGNRGLYTVMFMHRFRNFCPTVEAEHIAARTYQALVINVERCQQLGYFSNTRASDGAQVVWAACHGYVALELLDINFAANRDDTFERLLAALRDGFR
jgi:AcrR family transcriptional regulator